VVGFRVAWLVYLAWNDHYNSRLTLYFPYDLHASLTHDCLCASLLKSDLAEQTWTLDVHDTTGDTTRDKWTVFIITTDGLSRVSRLATLNSAEKSERQIAFHCCAT
jgi:hypothetical protein